MGKGAMFSLREARVGLACDVGTLQQLPRIVGCESWTRDLAFTGRDVGAEEALQRGLVQEVLDDRVQLATRAAALARQIAANSPLGVRATKASLLFSREHSVADGLENVRLMNQVYLQAPDLAMAVQAFKTRKQATFPDLPGMSKL